MKIKNNTCYYCKTAELAEQFLKECEEQGFLWYLGEKPTDDDMLELLRRSIKDYDWNGVTYGVTFIIGNYKKNRILWQKNRVYSVDFPMIEYNPEVRTICIKTDGKTVTAYMGDKKGIAKCSPEDTFDLYTGAKLAIDRLFDKEKQEENTQKINYKSWIGKKVRVIDNGFSFSTHLDWVKEHAPEYIGEYSYNHSPENGAVGKVIAVDIEGMLFISVFLSYYLIDSKGVELIEENTVNIGEFNYE